MNVDISKLADIDGAMLLQYVIFTSQNSRTGHSIHTNSGLETPVPYGLAICKYEDSEGVYLFYCNSEWKPITDTWHPNVQAAQAQAAFEYEELENTWILVT